MRVTRKLLIVVAVLLVALLVGAVVGWFAAGPSSVPIEDGVSSTSDTKIPPVTNVVAAAPRPTLLATNRTRWTPRRTRPSRSSTKTNQVAVAGAPSPASNSEEWENKIDTILTDNSDDAQKAKKMLELLPQLPEDGQEEAAEHIANLLPDDQYAAARQLLTNAKTTEGVRDALMSDLLNRPNELKLPTLLEIARTPEHPGAEEAKDFLELYLEKDYGTDWAQWEQAMQVWLKDNPE
ncbi:MAG: hypothetical protein HY298_03655 [Verrucomicrobia bacterium]|nr:hypothetical protein [Verrucomicrobiota bacterium]